MPLRDIRGQEHAVAALQRGLAAGKLHHACLLEGPSGVGKTLLATELARTVLCSEPVPGPDACGRCVSCGRVERGTNVDLHVVTPPEGKSAIGVGQVRDVRSLVELPPNGGRARVVVIDGADAMTQEAQNALLKTLEEPPGHAQLLLTTSRPRGLLPTIRSRCSRLRLAPLADRVVLELVSTARPEATPEALRIAATLAQGSVSRALQLLDSDLDELRRDVARLHDAVEREAVLELLETTEELGKTKERLLSTLELLVLWYRDVLVVAAGRDGSACAYSDRVDEARACARRIGVAGAATRMAGTVEAIDAVTHRNANPRLTTEAMLLRMLS